MSQQINSKNLIDVEELRSAQIQIESGRELYYDLYDLAPVGYCTLSEKGLILEANLTSATLLGTNRAALSKQPISRFIVKEDQDLYSLHREKLFETGEAQEYDLRLLKPDGAFFWAHLKVIAAQAKDGTPVCRVVLVDITERKQAEAALQTAVAFQEKLLQNLLAGVIIVDPVTRQIEQVNEHAAALFGTPAERLLGQRCHARICPAEEGACPVCDLGKTVDSSERVLIRADGSRLPILKTVKHVSLGGQEKLLECFVDISERTLAEEALRGNVTLLKTVLSAITGPLAVINADDYSIAMANEAYGGDTVVGKSCFAVSHNLSQPCSGSDHPCPLLQVVSSGQAFTTEHIHFTKGGEPLNIEITAYPIFDDFGKVRQIVEFGQDVTERKRAEETLREQRDFAEGLIETAQSIILVLDTQGRIVQFNSYMEELVGYELDEVKGQDWFETFIRSDNGNPVKSVFQDTVADIQTSGTVNPIIAKDGRTILVEWSNKTLKDKDGLTVGVLAIGQDITERKQAETYREMGLELLQILNEPGDLQESLQHVIAALKTQTGVDAVGLRLQVGEDFPYFVQDGFPADFLQTENTLLERGKDCGVCRNKDGKVHLECTCGLAISGQAAPSNSLFTKGGSCWTNDSFPLLDLPSDQDPRRHPRNTCIHQGYASVALIPVRTSDRVVGLIQLNDKRKNRFTLETIEILEGIAAHIGSALMRKRAEAEQEKLQAQLNQAHKMEAIGTMAGGIAHDFNNLLAIVSSNIEAIQIKLEKKIPLEKNVENIATASTRAKNLVSQILAFSRQEKAELKTIDLSATIEESLKLLRSTIPKTIELMNVLENRPLFIDADSTLIQQVLFNLCNNATYAMNGKGLLKVALDEVDISSRDLPVSSKLPAGTYAKISISDTGSGIDKDTITKIFDPFFTTKDVGIGTGMGLSVVHGIVEQHGGFITVDSSPGQGTTFDVYFPLSTQLYTEIKTSKTEPVPTGTESILFVDDEECIAYTCNELLECQGYRVTSVTSGREALDLFKANPDGFDLVITDQTMPVMSGAELASELLKIRPDIPIILCSGYSAMVSEADAKGIGIREFCMKPMDMKQLATVARNVLDARGVATSAE